MSESLDDLSLRIWHLHDLALRLATQRLEAPTTPREARTRLAAEYPPARQALAMLSAGLDLSEALTDEPGDRQQLRGLEIMLDRVAEEIGLVAPGAALKNRRAA